MKNVITIIETVDDIKELIIFGSNKDSISDHEEFLLGWKHGYQSAHLNKFTKVSFKMEDAE
ncbi:hypothetical protein CPT_Metamorpho_045 [Klebsiella phage Metamorpho]|nr:hypothetical protein CPT_Metamorpho_045 [Klebsiella phage Metamorpho]